MTQAHDTYNAPPPSDDILHLECLPYPFTEALSCSFEPCHIYEGKRLRPLWKTTPIVAPFLDSTFSRPEYCALSIYSAADYDQARIDAIQRMLLRKIVAFHLGNAMHVPEVYAIVKGAGNQCAGILHEWVQARPWNMQIDDTFFQRNRPSSHPDYQDPEQFPSEYTAKRFFMARIHRLLHDAGFPHLAAHYKWSMLGTSRIMLRTGKPYTNYSGLTMVSFPHEEICIDQLQRFIEHHGPSGHIYIRNDE